MGGTLEICENFTVKKKFCIFFLSFLYTYHIQISIICMTTTQVYIHGWSKGGNKKFQKSKKNQKKIKKIKLYNKNK